MNKVIAATTGVVVVALALAACSATPTAPRAPKAAQVETGQTNARVYSASDLASILDAVDSSLSLGGSIASDGNGATSSLDAIDVLMRQPGTTFAPTSCAAFATSDGRSLLALGATDVVSAELTSSQLNLIAIAAPGAKLPAAFTSGFESTATSALATCKHVVATITASGAASTISITTAAIPASVGANATIGFTEAAAASGDGTGTSRSSWTTIEAIDGNLELFVQGVSEQDVPSLEKALSAAVDAANK
ncbi:MAG TPA: hypothetical protein VHX87_06015 [Galbitalea sp.]|nr:hypothetical protein [Galbitalea sp.]